MNKTFNTLLAIQEEKIRNLHQSDMNMAVIREQLHKEILELFLYEYQTMNHRLKNIKTDSMDSVPQFCSNWCMNMDSSRCKESVAKLHIDNQRLLERERQLKLRLQRQPDLPQSHICVNRKKLAAGGIIVALFIIMLCIPVLSIMHRRRSGKYRWDKTVKEHGNCEVYRYEMTLYNFESSTYDVLHEEQIPPDTTNMIEGIDLEPSMFV
jgi:hypothetical protein